jgi:hypothetical protein
MKTKKWMWGLGILVIFISCEKEYSEENGGVPDPLIVGADCRISKIVYTDTATNSGLGSIAADINSLDFVTKITRYDSLSNTIEFIGTPTYINDTIYINPDEYFIVDVNKRITRLHGLIDPTDAASLQFDQFYNYNTAGYLVAKIYFLTIAPTIPVYRVDYIYTTGNLTRMTRTDLGTGDLEVDADLSYYLNIIPRRYIYIFPDDNNYSSFNQFFNFGTKNYNAVKKMTVRNYDPGNVVRDSAVSSFSNYILSRDTYVLSVQMDSVAQPSIPALAGKLSFSYKCK